MNKQPKNLNKYIKNGNDPYSFTKKQSIIYKKKYYESLSLIREKQ